MINHVSSTSKKQTRSVWKIYRNVKNDDYTARYFLDSLYHQNYYKFIAIDLSRQKIYKYPSKN